MRVITGTARGTKLKTPEGMLTRPTTDRVKEALFNIIQFDIAGDVLDPDYDSTVAVDIDAQRAYLEDHGTDTSEMEDIDIAKANTGSTVYLVCSVKFVDAMEDLTLRVNM